MARYRFADIEIDQERQELRRQGVRQEIQAQCFDLLELLAVNHERVVTHEEIRTILWPGTVVGDSSLAQAVRRARSAIGDDGDRQQMIRTIRRKGYRLVTEVERLEPETKSHESGPDDRGVAGAPLAGRNHELARLAERVVRSEPGHGDVIVIRDEAGMVECHLHAKAGMAAE